MQPSLVKKKTLVPFIADQFPSFIRERTSDINAPDGDKAMMVAFMEAYYEWLEQQGNATGRLYEFEKLQQTDYSIVEFFDHLRNTYLNNIPNGYTADPALLIKHIREFYKSKGSAKAIKFIFRLYFGEDVEISYNMNRRMPGDPIDFQNVQDTLGSTFILGDSVLGITTDVLFLNYNSIHTISGRLSEDFVLGSSTLVPDYVVLEAQNQGIDLNTFDGTILTIQAQNYEYFIDTAQDEEDFSAILKETTHPAGTQFYKL